ncbi:MAG: dephospho-CoA kinase [Petrimonas sp.]|nr:dephospho-CoA kinase [Petrimonas sp.]
MIKIGVTGGIGSGKSVVSELLKLHGIPVYDADSEAKRLNDQSPVIRQKLTSSFGSELYINGKLDKRKLAQLIFNDPQKLQLANSIIHPELMKDYTGWAEKRKNYPFTAIDAAVLFEGGFERYVDKIITVAAPENIRFARASLRDNVPEHKISERAKNQLTDQEKINQSDFVIHNDNQHSVIQQVSDILNRLNG